MKDEVIGGRGEGGTTLVCFALEDEARAFRKLMAGRAAVSILVTGIGRKNAERAVRGFLQSNSPRCVFTCGFAGGLDPELKVGDVVFQLGLSNGMGSAPAPGAVFRALAENPDAPKSSECLCQTRAPDADRGARSATPGAGVLPDAKTLRLLGGQAATFHCASRVATTAAEKAELRRTTGKDVVEMESEAIRAVCAGPGIPCATVRVISDAATEDLPLDFNQLSNPDQSLNFGKLALAIAKAPGKIPALLHLQKNTSFAAKQLAEVLARVI